MVSADESLRKSGGRIRVIRTEGMEEPRIHAPKSKSISKISSAESEIKGLPTVDVMKREDETKLAWVPQRIRKAPMGLLEEFGVAFKTCAMDTTMGIRIPPPLAVFDGKNGASSISEAKMAYPNPRTLFPRHEMR
jgi:hypothetical protein